MKKSLLFLLLTFTTSFAQQMNKMSVVSKAEYLPNEIISTDNRDTNGEVIAGIKILSDLEGLSFESYNGIIKVVNKPGEDFLYLSPGERVITIRKYGFQPLMIILNDLGITLESGKVWQIRVTGDMKQDTLPIVIEVTPSDAQIFIDGQNKGTDRTMQLSIGEHRVKVAREGYRDLSETITVGMNNILFKYTLVEIDPILVQFRTKPSGARLFIDDYEKGITDKDVFLYPGNYKMRISKSGFLDHEENIQIKERSENHFTFSLTKSSVTFKLKTKPTNARVLINKENYSSRPNLELPPGRYKVEISCVGYYEQSETIELFIGHPVHKTYTLLKKTGKLQFTIQPVNAKILLKKGRSIIKEWQGSNFITNLMVGEYQIESSCAGFKGSTVKINILEDKIFVSDVSLEIGTDNANLITNATVIKNCSVRETYMMTSKKIKNISEGERVMILGEMGLYYKVQSNSLNGYVFKKYLRKDR